MSVDRDISRPRDLATERQPLLASPLLEYNRTDRSNGRLLINPDLVANDSDTLLGIGTKLSASAFNFFLSGVAMAAIGVMIPEFERHYSINDTQAALVFPAGVVGYLLATSTAHPIQLRFGRRGIAAISSASRLVFLMCLSSRPAFLFFLVSFVGFGYGTGLTDTAWNSWASGMSKPNVVQGILHGSFSAGCVAGPAVVTAILRTSSWPLLYAILACAICVELVVQTWAFRADTGMRIGPEISDGEETKTESLFRDHTLWICGIYYLVYQGIEASFTDWIVLFLIRTRHADPATAAYASSIFWFGMAVGRYASGAFTEWIGLRTAVSTYILVACCAQFLLMAIDRITAILVMLGLCGFFLAPLFPSGIVMLSSRTTQKDRTRMVAALIAMGQVGGAIVPFGMGVLATHLGTQYLLHVTLSLSIVLLGLWAAISRIRSDAVAVETTQGTSPTASGSASRVADPQ